MNLVLQEISVSRSANIDEDLTVAGVTTLEDGCKQCNF